MATYYLKNISGSIVTVTDLGISLPTGESLTIDSNSINGYLTADLSTAVNSGDLILSTTDIGDNGGDMSSTEAIQALSITSRFDQDNPHRVTITQSLSADVTTNVSVAELNELVSGSDTTLHTHDDRYYTETELQTSGSATIHWDNITNAPQFGALEWKTPVFGNLKGMGSTGSEPTAPNIGDFFLNTDDNHLYQWAGSAWVDQGAPSNGDRVIFKDGVGSDDRIYEWDGSIWTVDPAPQDNWAVIVSDDGDGKSAQYVYDTSGSPPDWIKIADVDWGNHQALAGREAANSHPANAISFDNTGTGLSAINVQSALAELATEQGVDLDNIIFVSKNGDDSAVGVELGTIANPFLTIQAAINSITTASSTNRFVVYIMPGDYQENITLNKDYVYLASLDRNATRITSNSGDTVLLSSTTQKATGIYNLTLVSSSTTTTDSTLHISANNPLIRNVIVSAGSGARTAYIDAAYNQTLRHVEFLNGSFRVDAGVVDFYDSKVIEGLVNITGGTTRITNGIFTNNGGDAISQSGGTVIIRSGKITSGSGSQDYNQSAGTVYWGWVEYDDTKTTFSGTKTLLFNAGDLYYDSSSNTQITGDDIDAVINNIDNLIQTIINNSTTHEGDTNNPHAVTFTQAVTADSDTDITAAEAEILTDTSNADSLHKHSASNITYVNTTSGLSAANVQNAIDELATELGSNIENVVYVSKNGTDTSPVSGVVLGTYDNPFLTVQAAIDSITDATSSKYYVVFVMPGTYEESLTFKSYVGIVGISKEGTRIRPASGGTHTGTFTTGGRWFASNVGFGGPTQNMVFTHPTGASGGTSVWLDNVQIGTFTANFLGGGVDYVQFRNDTNISGTTVIHSANVTAYNSQLMGGLTIDDSGVEHLDGYGSASSNTVKDCMGGDLVLQGAVENVWVEFYNNYSWGTLTADGNAAVHIDAQSAPDNRSDLISLNGGNFHLTDNAFAVGYDDSVTLLSADNVQDAIQALNSKITEFEMPSGTTFPGTPDPGDIFYRTDLNTTYQYDGSRSKWLSMTQMFLDWGSNVADGKYLNIHGAAATQTGYLMPYDGTIISVTAKIASGNQSKEIEIVRNNDKANTLDSFSLTSGSYSSVTKNIDFSAGDYIQAFVPSAGVPARDIVVMAVVVWRG